MNRVLDALNLEKKNILEIKKQYEEELATLPKGYIQTQKKKSGKCFYQLVYMEKRKNHYQYIGENKTAIQEQLDRRKELEEELKFIEYDLKALNKMLGIATKQVSSLDTREQLRKMRANKGTYNKDEPTISKAHGQSTSNIYIEPSKETLT